MQTKIKMQFDPQIAKDLGVEEAIMYANIEFWVEHNKANDKNNYDGEYWTYNSMEAFTELFPFWTRRQIERILKKLEDKGYIKTGNYNAVKYDRTKWYTCISPNREMDSTKPCNRKNQTVKPIPDNKPNDKLDNKQTYGEFGNVKLSEEEQAKLHDKYEATDVRGMITELDLYIESSGKKYKSHYATLLNWAKRKQVRQKMQQEHVEEVSEEDVSRNMIALRNLKEQYGF